MPLKEQQRGDMVNVAFEMYLSGNHTIGSMQSYSGKGGG
jgi:hypothetical protein